MSSSDIASAVVDALPDPIAVLDPHGVIITVNAAWRRARARELHNPPDVGADYLRHLDAYAAELVRAALERQRPGEMEQPSHTHASARWLRLRVRPLPAGGAVVSWTDVTAEVMGRRRISRSQAIMLDLETDGGLRWAADRWTDLRGRQLEEELGQGWLCDTPTSQRASLRARLQRSRPFVMERFSTLDARGQQLQLQVSFTRDVLEDGQRIGWHALAFDLSGIHRMLDIAQLATHDPLTGFENRRRLDEWLASSAGRIGVLYLDLDGLKRVNDQYGHAVGDQLIRASADRIRSAVRPDDLVCRAGGDEFVVVVSLDPSTPGHGLGLMADRLETAFRQPVQVGGHPVTQHVSIGLAIRGDFEDPTSLLGRADQAMYAAKQVHGSSTRWAAAPRALAGKG